MQQVQTNGFRVDFTGEELISPKELALLLPSTSVSTVQRWARKGKIPHVKLPSGRYFFRRSDVEALLRPSSGEGAHGGEGGEPQPAGALQSFDAPLWGVA